METVFRILGTAVQVVAFFLFCWCTPKKWYRILLTGILGAAFIWLLSDGFFLAVLRLFGLTAMELRSRERFFWVVIYTGQFLSLLGGWIVRQIRTGNRGRWLLLTLLLPLLSLIMVLIMLFTNLGRTDVSEATFFFCYILELSNVVAVILIHRTQKRTAFAQEMALLQQQLNIQSESILSLEKSYRTQRQSTHDYQSQLQTVWQLLSNGNEDSASDYVGQLLDTQSERVFYVNTGNPIIDAVVHQKFQIAYEQGIDASFKCNDLTEVALGMNELVVLLANLLDNAIEGCARYDGEQKLECSIILQDELFLSIRNTSPEVIIHGKTIPTTKIPKNEHGFGLRTVRRILDQNNAQYSFRYTDGWFEFVAEIPNAKAGR